MDGQSLTPARLYAHERESVLVPLPFLDLPTPVRLLDLTWHRKSEFHVTAAHTPSIAERASLPVEAAWKAILAAIEGSDEIGEVALLDEFRIARRAGERTLIRMCEVGGLPDLFARLSEQLGARVDPPPAHVTIYVDRPGAGGIGIHTREQLERDTAPLPPEAAAELARSWPDGQQGLR